MNFTDAELHVLALALQVARDQYKKDASDMRTYAVDGESTPFKRVARQFDTQIDECTALLTRLAEEGYL